MENHWWNVRAFIKKHHEAIFRMFWAADSNKIRLGCATFDMELIWYFGFTYQTFPYCLHWKICSGKVGFFPNNREKVYDNVYANCYKAILHNQKKLGPNFIPWWSKLSLFLKKIYYIAFLKQDEV